MLEDYMFSKYSPYILVLGIMPAFGLITFSLLTLFTKLPQEKRMGGAGAAFILPASIYALIGFYKLGGLKVGEVLTFTLLPIIMYFAGIYYWKGAMAQYEETVRIYKENKKQRKSNRR